MNSGLDANKEWEREDGRRREEPDGNRHSDQ